VGAYYYFAAQLPYLVYGQGEPMSVSRFRDLCQTFLEPQDREDLDRCTLDIPNTAPSSLPPVYGEPKALHSEFIGAWREWERSLRLNLARFRAQKLKREALDAPEYPSDAAQAAKAACALESPLEAEILLDKARWDAVERLRGLDNFGSNFIFAYLLKLSLMERRSSFKTEEGFIEYKTLYTSIMESWFPSAESGLPAQSLGGVESGVPK
jgi:hypothetical protein